MDIDAGVLVVGALAFAELRVTVGKLVKRVSNLEQTKADKLIPPPLLALVPWLVLVGFAVAGCGRGRSLPPGNGAPGFSGGPAGILETVALTVSGVCAVALIGCAIAAWFAPNKFIVGRIAVACLTGILASQALFWLASNLALGVFLAGFVGVIGLIVYIWLNHKELEKRWKLDLNRNGVIGK